MTNSNATQLLELYASREFLPSVCWPGQNRNFRDPHHSLSGDFDLCLVGMEAHMVSKPINSRFGSQVPISEWQREDKVHDLLKLADECFALAKTAVKADVRHALTEMGNDYLEKAEKLKRA
jgi:hypothetical protein